MEFTYKKHTWEVPGLEGVVEEHYGIQRSDGWWITKDEANTHWQIYLEWLAAGNTLEPADE